MRKNKNNLKAIEDQLRLIKDKKKNFIEVGKYLGTSRQTISTWYDEYISSNILTSRVNEAHNKISIENEQKILDYVKDWEIKRDARFGTNRSLGKWKLSIKWIISETKTDLSKEHIRKLLIDNCILTSGMTTKTKKLINKKLKEQLKNKSIPLAEAKEIRGKIKDIENVVVLKGKVGSPGYRSEIDGCSDHFFGMEKATIHTCVDYFSGALQGIYFDTQETNHGYFNMLTDVFTNYGVPCEIRSDNRNGLAYGEIKDAVNRLDVLFTHNSHPNFKPNVERVNSSLQDWLPLYVIQNNINNISEANSRRFEIIDAFNDWNKKHTNFENHLGKRDDIKNDFYIMEEMPVANKISHINYLSKKWAPFNNQNQRQLMNSTVEVFKNLDGQIYTKRNNEWYYFKEIKDVLLTSEQTKEYYKLEQMKQSSKSYNYVIDKKVKSINLKIDELNKKGANIAHL